MLPNITQQANGVFSMGNASNQMNPTKSKNMNIDQEIYESINHDEFEYWLVHLSWGGVENPSSHEAERVLGDGIMEIITLLMQDRVLAPTNCTVKYFIELRIEEIEIFIMELDGQYADRKLIAAAQLMMNFWQLVMEITNWHAHLTQPNYPKPAKEIDWDILNDFADADYDELRLNAGHSVFIVTLIEWFRTWVEEGEILGQIVDCETAGIIF